MKICFIRTDYSFNQKVGGSVSHIAGFTKAVKALGHTIFFLSTDKLTGIDEKTFKIPPPWFLRKPIGLFRILFNFYFILKTIHILKKEKPDVIYQRHSIFSFCGAALSKITGIPLILEVNCSEVYCEKHWGGLRFEKIAAFIENKCFEFADKIMVVSEYVKKQLIDLGADPQKIRVNANGVDPEQFYPQISGEKIRSEYKLQNKIVAGFVGTYSQCHGTSVLAKAIKPVVKNNADIHFLNIGRGVLRDEFDRIIKEDEVGDHVTNIDMVPHSEIPDYLAACDILLSPMLQNDDGSELFHSPIKLFEYMGMGKAIIASRAGQIKDILHDGQNAVLVEPGDQVSLAKAIIKLAENKSLRESLGKAANQTALENYTWRLNALRVLEAYNEIK